MKISVIIPAYNGAATIANSIESILRQTRAPDEVIVSDDCSTDQTAEVAEDYAGRVRYVGRPRNGGLSANRNTGVRASQGDWLLFLDQDDVLLPHALESLSATAETSGAGVVYGFVLLRGSRPERARLHGLPWAAGEPPAGAKANFWWTAITSTGCALFRRSLIDEVGEFDEAITQGEDCEFWLRCGITCPFAHCDTVVLKKYETPGSLGSSAAGSIWWRLHLQRKFLAWCAERSLDTTFLDTTPATTGRSRLETHLAQEGLVHSHPGSGAGTGPWDKNALVLPQPSRREASRLATSPDLPHKPAHVFVLTRIRSATRRQLARVGRHVISPLIFRLHRRLGGARDPGFRAHARIVRDMGRRGPRSDQLREFQRTPMAALYS